METTANHTNKDVERAVIGDSSAEALAGAAALVLAVLGLAQIEPWFMIAIAAIATVVLGILALVGIDPMTLILIAMLALGASILLTGSAVVGKMLSIFSAWQLGSNRAGHEARDLAPLRGCVLCPGPLSGRVAAFERWRDQTTKKGFFLQ
jgi:hypothetical protein